MHVNALSAGTSVGRYRLDERVNRGGMGEVWRAFDAGLGRPVAVKLLHEGVTDAGDRERFIREAQAAAQLNHPNVVAIFDVGEWSGRPFLVMELLNGRTLAEELAERGPLPLPEVRSLGAQAAAGLTAAHAAGVVHRDIKPSNLVCTRDGTLKVVDFGIARVLDEASTRLTRTGTIVGTAAYLAPEQARGLAADARTDLYALGCVLYQLLSGRTPFVGGPTEVMYAHLYTMPEPPSRLRPDVPPDLEALVLALLAKDPRERPADASTVRAALLGDPAAVPPRRAPDPVGAPTIPGEPRGMVPVSFDDPAADGTRAYPLDGSADLPPTADRGAPSRRWLALAAVAAAVVAVAVVAWSLQNGWNPVANNAGGGPSATEKPTKPTPSPSSASPQVDAETPALEYGSPAWLHRLDVALATLAANGAIDPRAASDLRETIADALQKYSDNRPAQAHRKVEDLIDELRKAREHGDLSGADRLNDVLDGTLPAGVLDGGDNTGDGGGKGGKGRG